MHFESQLARGLNLVIYIPTTSIMFRSSLVRASRASVPSVQAPIVRKAIVTPFSFSRSIAPRVAVPAFRCYSAHAGLNRDEVQGRILDLLKNFDKVSLIKDWLRHVTDLCASGQRRIKGTHGGKKDRKDDLRS